MASNPEEPKLLFAWHKTALGFKRAYCSICDETIRGGVSGCNVPGERWAVVDAEELFSQHKCEVKDAD